MGSRDERAEVPYCLLSERRSCLNPPKRWHRGARPQRARPQSRCPLTLLDWTFAKTHITSSESSTARHSGCSPKCRRTTLTWDTEQILNDRTALLKSTQCPQELEKKIGGGQLEECIIQAKYELDLAKRILEERAWEPLISEPPKNQWKWPL